MPIQLLKSSLIFSSIFISLLWYAVHGFILNLRAYFVIHTNLQEMSGKERIRAHEENKTIMSWMWATSHFWFHFIHFVSFRCWPIFSFMKTNSKQITEKTFILFVGIKKSTFRHSHGHFHSDEAFIRWIWFFVCNNIKILVFKYGIVGRLLFEKLEFSLLICQLSFCSKEFQNRNAEQKGLHYSCISIWENEE